MKIPRDKWEWQGMAGHFCLADRCRFHLATKVGQYLISSVGAMYDDKGVMLEIGAGYHYETKVFRIVDGDIDLSEIDGENFVFNQGVDCPYELDKKVEEVHVMYCEKYSEPEFQQNISDHVPDWALW